MSLGQGQCLSSLPAHILWEGNSSVEGQWVADHPGPQFPHLWNLEVGLNDHRGPPQLQAVMLLMVLSWGMGEGISFNIWSRIQVNSPALNSSARLEYMSMRKSFLLLAWERNHKYGLQVNHGKFYQTLEFRKMLQNLAFIECIWIDYQVMLLTYTRIIYSTPHSFGRVYIVAQLWLDFSKWAKSMWKYFCFIFYQSLQLMWYILQGPALLWGLSSWQKGKC